MKKFFKDNKNEIIRVLLLSTVAVLCIVAVTNILPTMVFCDDLFSIAEDSLGSFKTKLVNLSFAIFPVALIVCLVMIAITHNDKKISMYRSILITICVVEAAILLVNSNYVLDLIKSLVGYTG